LRVVWLMHRARRFYDRFALVRQQCWHLQPCGFCPKGVGAGLARELARSASKTCKRDLADASRTIVGQQQPTCTPVVSNGATALHQSTRMERSHSI